MKILFKVALVAGAAYGVYYLYKNYFKDNKAKGDFGDLADAGFDYDDEAVKEESFAEKIKAAAQKQLDRIS